MADEIRVDYLQLRSIATRFSHQANAIRQTQQRIDRSSSRLQEAWSGRGSQAFFAEMTTEVLPALSRLAEALARAQAVTLQINQILQTAEEEAARPFRTKGMASDTSGSTAGPSPWRSIIDTARGVAESADTTWDVIPIPAAIALALGLQAGSTYSGQVLVRGSQLLKDLGISGRTLRELAGVSGHLNHIKAANISTHIWKMTRTMVAVEALISAGKGVIAVADVWERRGAEYASYGLSRNISAHTMDAGMASLPVAGEFLGGVGGAWLGAKTGMLVGGQIGILGGPGGIAVGTVAGGIIGAAIGGFAGDWLGGRTGESAARSLEKQVGRDQLINVVDEVIVAPVVDTISAAAQAVGSWFAPAPEPQGVSAW